MADIDLAVSPRRRSRWPAGAYGWLALSAGAIVVLALVPYATTSLPDLARGGSTLAANYADRPPWARTAFYLHISAGGLALLLSPAQFSSRLRRRAPRLHRATGRTVLGAIAVAGSAGAVLAPLSLAGAVGTAGFGTLAVLWVCCAAATYAAIRRRDVGAHWRWAVRTFSLTYAAVMLRLELGLLIGLQVGVAGVADGVAFDRAYLLVPFLSWVPNLLVAEYLVRRSRFGPPVTVLAPRLAH
jgi:hypothetical protein